MERLEIFKKSERENGKASIFHQTCRSSLFPSNISNFEFHASLHTQQLRKQKKPSSYKKGNERKEKSSVSRWYVWDGSLEKKYMMWAITEKFLCEVVTLVGFANITKKLVCRFQVFAYGLLYYYSLLCHFRQKRSFFLQKLSWIQIHKHSEAILYVCNNQIAQTTITKGH